MLFMRYDKWSRSLVVRKENCRFYDLRGSYATVVKSVVKLLNISKN